MNRRSFVQLGLAAACGTQTMGALRQERLDQAAEVLSRAVATGQVTAAAVYVAQRESAWTRGFGAADEQSMFLLGSISKPIVVMGLLTLVDRGELKLDDPVQKYLPAFTGEGRERATIRHLLTHVSGLPDQLPENDALRRRNAPLTEFAEHAVRTPLHFAPGTRYEYSSMAILLAARIVELVRQTDIRLFVDQAVFQPLDMRRSAQGVGKFRVEEFVPCQTEHAAPEAGGGDPNAKSWDWNSRYWRELGSPWGGTHASAADVGRFLRELLEERGAVLRPETARWMTTNQNPPGLTPRGLGLSVGASAGSTGCSSRTFGHTGSTGTLAWADPATETTCVVLTSLPARAVQPHPRDLAGNLIAAATARPAP